MSDIENMKQAISKLGDKLKSTGREIEAVLLEFSSKLATIKLPSFDIADCVDNEDGEIE